MAREESIKIRILMMRKGISGAEIARRLSVTRATVNGVINFKWRSPRIRAGIAKALGKNPPDLWPEERCEQ
jgi:lambda repressor-like predicted transcriptional regulator